jgi:hypothetical protein
MKSTSQIKNLDVYPNPSRDIFNIRFVSEKIQELSIKVLNVYGELVFEENIGKFIGEFTKSLDLSMSPKGIYILEIKNDDNFISKKIVIQ